MRYTLLIVIALVSVINVSSQELPDSTVVFKFKAGKDLFWADYRDNRTELDRLANFLQGNRAKIMRGQKPIYVDGYCLSMPDKDENMAMAKVRSNRVKSYMVSMYGFKEGFFHTQNHADSIYGQSDIVLVSFLIPRQIKQTPTIQDTVIIQDTVVEQDIVVDTIPVEEPVVEIIKDSVVRSLIPLAPATAIDDHQSQSMSFEDPRSYSLLEKDTYYMSLYANFNDAAKYNMLIEPLFDIHKIYNRNIDIHAAFGYFVSNNVAVGLYGGYKLSDIRVDVSSDILQLLINSKRYQTNNISTGYNIGAFTKTFIPLEYAHRIFLVNEASLYFSQMRSLSRNVYDQGAMISKVYQNTYTGGIKLSIGFMYFLCNGLTMEFNISPVAAQYQYNTVLNNETLKGKFSGGGINTILLPLDLKFGLSYFFGLDYKKNKRHINYVQSNFLK